MIKGIFPTEWGISAHYHEHADTNPEDIDCLRIVEGFILENLRSSVDLSHLIFILKPFRTVFSHAKVDEGKVERVCYDKVVGLEVKMCCAQILMHVGDTLDYLTAELFLGLHSKRLIILN